MHLLAVMMGLRIEEEGVEAEDIEAAASDLVAKLDCKDLEAKHAAVRELRAISRGDERYRCCVADAGGIEALLPLLQSSDSDVQKNAITTLLNLSVDLHRITETYSAFLT